MAPPIPRKPTPKPAPTPSPEDKAPPSRKGLIALIAALCVLAAGAIVVVATKSSKVPVVTDTGDPTAAPTAEPSPGVIPTHTGSPGSADDEAAAKDLFEAGEKLDKGPVDQADRALAKFREVSVRFPFSPWARKADERSIALEARLKEYFEKEFEAARRTAADFVKSGKVRKAVESLRSYIGSNPKEILKRRAELEITILENAARFAYNECAKQAGTLVNAGAHGQAAALMKAFGTDSIEDVAVAAAKDLEAIESHRAQFKELQARLAVEAADGKFRARAKSLLDKLKLRQYEEVLKEFDAAIKDPANAPIRAAIEQERAIPAAAAAFWEGFLKGIRSRNNQDVALQLSDGKFARGTVKKVLDDRVVLKLEESEFDVFFDKLHADQVLLLAVGKQALPDSGAETYLRAAMWFYLEGRHDLARLELATAKELGFAVDGIETAWREGYFRSAMTPKK